MSTHQLSSRTRIPYSYRPLPRQAVREESAKRRRSGRRVALFATILLLSIGVVGYAYAGNFHRSPSPGVATAVAVSNSPATLAKQTKSAPVAAAHKNYCADNSLDQVAYVSISARHMWACEKTQQVYESAVITGNMMVASDATPTGTFHVYAKESNTTLTGPTWNDYVHNWMPFYENQYGTYGFHDATWRADNAFGNVSPDTSDASHGCVELPLATADWLYKWAQIGLTVTITK